MKRTTKLKLKRRLELIRMTVRELTPQQLDEVKGGNTEHVQITTCGWTLNQ